jgi:hypothetical protein
MLGHLVVGRYGTDLQVEKSDAATRFLARVFRALFRRKRD